jgi:uncharacterized OB-fold protein
METAKRLLQVRDRTAHSLPPPLDPALVRSGLFALQCPACGQTFFPGSRTLFCPSCGGAIPKTLLDSALRRDPRM